MENKLKKLDLKFRMFRDAGDVRKVDKCVTIGSSYITKPSDACDRGNAACPIECEGDTAAKTGVDKIKTSDKKLTDVLPKNIERTPNYVPPAQAKESDRRKRGEYIPKDPPTKMAEMKKIRENYTFRNKFSCVKRVNVECIKKTSDEKIKSENDRATTWPNDEVKLASPANGEPSPKDPFLSVVSQKETIRGGSSNMKRKASPNTASQQLIRRPIIKTITSTSDKTKVYKAVNFVDRKVHPTTLQINIPTDMKKTKESKAKPALSKVSLKEKRRREKKKRRVRSPNVSPEVAVKIRSPPTEVAKWATADKHKKVYYEAWVDTTLAAISKKVKENKFDKHKLVHTFRKALTERPVSPEIDYKMLLDEQYTGKIIVNKR